MHVSYVVVEIILSVDDISILDHRQRVNLIEDLSHRLKNIIRLSLENPSARDLSPNPPTEDTYIMSRYPQIQSFLLLIPLLLLFLIQNTVAEAEAEPVIISGATNWVSSAPEDQADGSAPKSRDGWWTVDRSSPSTGPADAWWTGCNNRTSDEQVRAPTEISLSPAPPNPPIAYI